MKLRTVTKRSGDIVPYNRQKIYNAILEANNATTKEMTQDKILDVTVSVENDIENFENVSVEEIQDIVEKQLMEHSFFDIAKAYIEYRQVHALHRKAHADLIQAFRDVLFTKSDNSDMKRENANINSNSPMGMMLKIGTESSKYFIDNYVLPEEFAKADVQGYVHYHDKDFSLITFNCCQIDLLKVCNTPGMNIL